MKILITGATGFIGSYVTRHLLRKGYYDLFALRRSTSKMCLVNDLAKAVSWIEGNLFDLDVLDSVIKNVDVIIHVAGRVSMSPRLRQAVFKTNVEGTANLINLALDHKIKRFIHISSVSAFGLMKEKIDESIMEVDHQPKSVYSLSKYLGEREAWRGYVEGLNLSIVNPSFVIGGSYWHTGPLDLIQRLDHGLKFYPIGSNGVVDVRDVASMCCLLLEKEDTSGQKFICNADNLSHLNVIKLICDRLNKPYPTIPLTGVLGEVAWRFESFKSLLTGKESLFSKEAYEIASSKLTYDNSLSLDYLNFHYKSVKETIHDTVDCYIQSKKKNQKFGILD